MSETREKCKRCGARCWRPELSLCVCAPDAVGEALDNALARKARAERIRRDSILDSGRGK